MTAKRHNSVSIPIRGPILLLCGFFERTLYKYLAILPPHHPQVDRLGDIFLDEFVNAQFA
jgi:hypothetical protein